MSQALGAENTFSYEQEPSKLCPSDLLWGVFYGATFGKGGKCLGLSNVSCVDDGSFLGFLKIHVTPSENKAASLYSTWYRAFKHSN